MRLGEGTSMVCTGDEDQYEGFNSAAAQFCMGDAPRSVDECLNYVSELFSDPDAIDVLMEAESDDDSTDSSGSSSDYSYYDEGDPEIIPSEPAPMGRQSSYEVMDMKKLEAHLRSQIEQAVRFLRSSASTACVLLRHCDWDLQELSRRWKADKVALATAAGTKLTTEVVSTMRTDDDAEMECEICMGELQSWRSISCGHAFCEECWQEYLLAQVGRWRGLLCHMHLTWLRCEGARNQRRHPCHVPWRRL